MAAIYPGLSGEIIDMGQIPMKIKSTGTECFRYFDNRNINGNIINTLHDKDKNFKKFSLTKEDLKILKLIEPETPIYYRILKQRCFIDSYEIFGKIKKYLKQRRKHINVRIVTKMFYRDVFTGLGFILEFNGTRRSYIPKVSSNIPKTCVFDVIDRLVKGDHAVYEYDTQSIDDIKDDKKAIDFLSNNVGLNGFIRLTEERPIIYDFNRSGGSTGNVGPMGNIGSTNIGCAGPTGLCVSNEMKTFLESLDSKVDIINNKVDNKSDINPTEIYPSLRSLPANFDQRNELNKYSRKSKNFETICKLTNKQCRIYWLNKGSYDRLLFDFNNGVVFLLSIYDFHVFVMYSSVSINNVIKMLDIIVK